MLVTIEAPTANHDGKSLEGYYTVATWDPYDRAFRLCIRSVHHSSYLFGFVLVVACMVTAILSGEIISMYLWWLQVISTPAHTLRVKDNRAS